MTTYDRFVKQGFEQGLQQRLEQVKVIIKQIIIKFPEMTNDEISKEFKAELYLVKEVRKEMK